LNTKKRMEARRSVYMSFGEREREREGQLKYKTK
jgi:hypothetical protein